MSVEPIAENKVPLQYQGQKIGNSIMHKIVINSNFQWGSIDSINKKLIAAHKSGQLASKDIEGLAVHEMGHFLTYFDCNTSDEIKVRNNAVQECYMDGISGYATETKDGALSVKFFSVNKNY